MYIGHRIKIATSRILYFWHMLIIHAVQKLLNTGKVDPVLYVSEPSEGQQMHSWYAKLLSTGFAGKMLVIYVHEPSLLMVLTKGKTVNSTIQEFYRRLPQVLERNNFKPGFIETEINLAAEGYVTGKTSSKSMLGSMNAITENIEGNCREFPTYRAIDLTYLEDAFSDWIAFDKTINRYLSVMEYWKEKQVLIL
jgi:hypothetical protein